MPEKWHEFVTRIKNETKVESLQEAMKIASKRKSEWQKGGSNEHQSKGGKSKKNKSKHNKTGRKK